MPHVQILSVEDKQIIALDLRRRLTRLGYAVVAWSVLGRRPWRRCMALTWS
jgi:hypothetical protein